MQRLVDVADKVHDKHEGLVDVCAAELGVLDAGGLGIRCQYETRQRIVEEAIRSC